MIQTGPTARYATFHMNLYKVKCHFLLFEVQNIKPPCFGHVIREQELQRLSSETDTFARQISPSRGHSRLFASR